jgi:hypothetical protein
MIPSGLTLTVIGRASLGDEYVRVLDSGLVTAVAQFLYDEAALLDRGTYGYRIGFHTSETRLPETSSNILAQARRADLRGAQRRWSWIRRTP